MSFVKYRTEGRVAVVTLDRPDRLNALGSELASDLEQACASFENDTHAPVLVVHGSGRAFSVGVDLREATERGTHTGVITDRVHQSMRSITKPIVAAVHGHVLGGGLWAVMLNADLRIAAESASFGMPEIRLAIPAVPQFFLAQNIPLCAVMELVLNDEPMTAKRAYDIGLVNKVVPDGELMDTAMKMAQRIAELSPWATKFIREARLKAVSTSERMLELEAIRQEIRSALAVSEDHQKALQAAAARLRR